MTFAEVYLAAKRARRQGQPRALPAEVGEGYRGAKTAREIFAESSRNTALARGLRLSFREAQP